MATVDATLENMLAEFIQRTSAANEKRHIANRTRQEADEADAKLAEARDALRIFRPGKDDRHHVRRLIFRSSVIELSQNGNVEIYPVEHVR